MCLSCANQPPVQAPETITSSQLVVNEHGCGLHIGTQAPFTGKVHDFHPDGVSTKYHAQLVNGYLEGEETAYYLNGKVSRKCLYANGKKNGLAIQWYPDGKMMSSSNYVANLPHGLCQHWNTNGLPNLKAVYTNGSLSSLATFFPDGKPQKISQFAKGKLNGRSEEWHPNGQKRWSRSFTNNLKHGLATGWYPDGRKKWENNWSHGYGHGPAKQWHPNGKIRSITSYRRGAKDGKALGAYETGAKEWEAHWRTNALHGVYREWHPDGQRKLERIYLANKKLSEYQWPMNTPPPAALARFEYGRKNEWTVTELQKFRGLTVEQLHFAFGLPNEVTGIELTYWNLIIQDRQNKNWQEATFQVQSNRISSIQWSREILD